MHADCDFDNIYFVIVISLKRFFFKKKKNYAKVHLSINILSINKNNFKNLILSALRGDHSRFREACSGFHVTDPTIAEAFGTGKAATLDSELGF